MIEPKTRQSYIWNDRKGAQKPNFQQAIKEINNHEIANTLFSCKLINNPRNLLNWKLWIIYLTAFLQKPKKPIAVWKHAVIIKAPCIPLIVSMNL